MKKRYVVLFFVMLFGALIWLLATTSMPANTPASPDAANTIDLGPGPSKPVSTPLIYKDMIVVESPRANDTIKSSVTVTGRARGNWFFEGSFPVSITDSAGNLIAQKYATANGEWMTTEYVPFEGTISFSVPAGVTNGYIVFRKDNPSGEPQFDDAVSLPVQF
ncbi:MAG TPA: Gmad2 immunoglobulin-like domain-containing protein [Candidatus Paceibacterota bacterium]